MFEKIENETSVCFPKTGHKEKENMGYGQPWKMSNFYAYKKIVPLPFVKISTGAPAIWQELENFQNYLSFSLFSQQYY